MESAVEVKNLSKIFRLPHDRSNTLKQTLINFGRNHSYEELRALDKISFKIKKGEFFGVVGRNGSGKSTLLKILAGIYTPTSGEIKVNGELTPFIELGIGFNPELTGRENVFLNGAILGLTEKEVANKYDEIVAFAELQRFMDQKLKNYSSGMQVRLAFSIAIQAHNEILLIDEVLAVGDVAFQQKCFEFFRQLKKRKDKTVILVTHDMETIRRFCSNAILIDDGTIIRGGSPQNIAEMYENINLRSAEERLEQENQGIQKKKRQGNQKAVIEKTETYNVKSGKVQFTFNASESIGVRINFKCMEDISAPAVGFIFQDRDDITVFAANNQILGVTTKPLQSDQTLIMEATIGNVFTDGEYTITCAIESDDLSIIYDRIEYIHKFIIGGHKLSHATTHPPQQMTIKYLTKT